MKLLFLGTVSATPTRSRNVSATAIQAGEQKFWYLVDCGEGTQHQLLKTPQSLHTLEAIFITHRHGDHCFGLPGLLASASLNGRQLSLTLVAPKAVCDFVQCVIDSIKMELGFDLAYIEIENQPSRLAFDHVEVDIAQLSHSVPSYAFKFIEKNIPLKLDMAKLTAQAVAPGPHYNLLQKGRDIACRNQPLKYRDYTWPSWNARRAVVCGDNDSPGILDSFIDDVHLLVHEATYTEHHLLRQGTETGHTSAKRIAEFAQNRSIAALALTHFSARYHTFANKSENQLSKLETEARHYYQGELFLVRDFDLIKIEKDGSCTLHSPV